MLSATEPAAISINKRQTSRHLAQQTYDSDSMLGQCWSTVYDAGKTLTQHWINTLCLLETYMYIISP